jgi:hypothetical protein
MSVLFWLLLAPVAWAQAPSVASGEPAKQPRIEILGASVSAGFVDGPLTGGSPDNRSTSLLRVVNAWLDGTDAQVRSGADMFLFKDAEGRAPMQVQRAIAREPDLVLAVDFLFWFGYGYVRTDAAAGADAEQAARLARLQIGLDLLDQVKCPMVVGDLPDVHGAARRMISPRQIPPVKVLDELDAAVARWAAARPRVHMFPLRKIVAAMKENGVELPLAHGVLATPPGGLMQGDHLHATRLGMAYLGMQLQEQIAAALPAGNNGWLPRFSFEQFVAAADAEGDLDLLQHPSETAGGR